MGKVTGFKEFDRKTEAYRPVELRLKDYGEIFTGSHDEAQLQEQGARCMDCGVPFCQSDDGCPVNNLIPEWNDLVYNDKWQEALTRLLKTNNFPEFTGRVCPAPCEGSCVLGVNNPAVTIKNIEQAIIDKGFEQGWIKPATVEYRTGKKIAVIGSGPAGLAAADELNKLGHGVTVFERDDRIGGLLMYGIPNMKLGKDVVDRRVDLMKDSGIEFIANVNVGKDITTEALQKDFDAIIFTTGASEARDLPVENRDANGVHLAMKYLTMSTKSLLDTGRGDMSELTAKDKDVIVIGGGDTGTDCIGTAIRQGAKSVTNFELMSQPPVERADNNPWPLWPLIYRVDYGHAEAQSVFGEDPRQYQLMTKSFIKDEQGNLTGLNTINVEFNNGQLSEITGTEKTWNTQLVLLSMGFVSPEHYLSNDANIELDGRGNYQAEYGQYQTSQDGIFTAGDCRRGQSLVVWAINEGRGVAQRVNEYLS
ncbi:Glutamate synthase [NADPH] small chain (EC 1.4.1.13) [uncultured Gammaproteobacteria bacterium]|uniref:glutamate synthase subunit beta n=1 Tax=Bathymodiolus heckerae thiotrophic gill symbiont TaxID=1052212 RepID=UPI0010BA7E9B|nr:glutamate synthase subunit beta [Bathymodiolus heckerae thiotrophic gill symbiont]CAC9604559.1 Glutamate synthase [NADPH] small chain (EC 1.4.1.13) [uncultured Gammaproteobacteria bacterium]SHN90394.1 Glutamate synthase [NADPH] small chain [Bathymodiolus heckerae thiotrophic gill symbiont]